MVSLYHKYHHFRNLKAINDKSIHLVIFWRKPDNCGLFQYCILIDYILGTCKYNTYNKKIDLLTVADSKSDNAYA